MEGLGLPDFQKFMGLKKSFTSQQGDLVSNRTRNKSSIILTWVNAKILK